MAKTVMIVEDNELNLKLFCDLLRAHGYEAEPVRDVGDEQVPDAALQHLPAGPVEVAVQDRPAHVGLGVAAAVDRAPADAGALQRRLDQVQRVVPVAGQRVPEAQERGHA